MRVLVYLAEHPGVVSKEQLISAVWPDVFVSEDVLPGCVSALRKTLSDDARRPKFIETIHKGGYRLLVPAERLHGNGAAHVTPETASVVTRQPSRTRRLAIALAVVVVAAVLVAAFAWPRHEYDSVAVLPFLAAASDSSTEYVGDGIAEQVV